MAVLRIRLTAKLANLIYLLRLNNSTMCLRYVMLTGRTLNALLFTFCTYMSDT